MKRFVSMLLCMIILYSCTACQRQAVPVAEPPEHILSDIRTSEEVLQAIDRREGYSLSAAVVYSSAAESDAYVTTLDYLRQSLVVNLEVTAVDAAQGMDLAFYDVVYLDESLLADPNAEALCTQIADYTADGGAVFVPNAFYDAFPADYFGVTGFEKLSAFPRALTLPEGMGDLTDLQELVSDFHRIYLSFADAEELQSRDYGYVAVTDTAIPLVQCEEGVLYAMNCYGDGRVLLVNPLLPNAFVQSSFSMTAQNEEQTAFASTAASCNQLILNEWASYVSKQIYGFSLDRVFGYYGTPSMSWQLHYEEITGIANNSLAQFSKLCESFGQVPSFTLIRNSYWWFARMESMTYLLNQGKKGEMNFQMDYNESAYSSGTHIDSGGEWLSLACLENAGSYFTDYPEQKQRLFPCAADYNGDGQTDFFCGSSDGTVTYFENLGFTGLDGRLRVSEGQTVTDSSGAPVSVGSFSAPQMLDVDGDGYLDLLVGGADGTVRWWRGNGTLSFAAQGILIQNDYPGQCLPAVGDLNGDGVADLLCGSDQSILLVYWGQRNGAATTFTKDRMYAFSKDCANWGLGKWLSPTLADYNGDGNLDIIMGSQDGYISLIQGDGKGGLTFDQFLTTREQNYKGNISLKFGTYCTPVLCDLDGDGALDLLCGSLEYGLAYPIDSPYFPYQKELQEQVDYVKEHHYYMGVHFYTNAYASAEREAYELAAHRKAMAAYGLSTDGVGANQHTWYTSRLGTDQTMRSLYNAGLLWESGFATSGASYQASQTALENTISLPFFLMDGDERTLLVQNNSVLPYLNTAWSDLSAKYEMPVCVYYHCDFIYKSDQGARDYLQKVSDFQWTFGYNFNKEDQMMYGSAAAYNLCVDVAAEGDSFTISPGVLSTDFPLYNEDAQRASGLRIDPSAALEETLETDAHVWKRTNMGLAVGLDGTVSIRFSGGAAEAADANHLEQVNVPANITPDENGTEIAFLGDGMLQAVVSGPASTPDAGWQTETRNGKTVFTKFGAADTLHITYLEEEA